jgi:hypothetical protein
MDNAVLLTMKMNDIASRYNYDPVFKMSSDFSKVEEVTDWEEDL